MGPCKDLVRAGEKCLALLHAAAVQTQRTKRALLAVEQRVSNIEGEGERCSWLLHGDYPGQEGQPGGKEGLQVVSSLPSPPRTPQC